MALMLAFVFQRQALANPLSCTRPRFDGHATVVEGRNAGTSRHSPVRPHAGVNTAVSSRNLPEIVD
jgi:hypothetical protein